MLVTSTAQSLAFCGQCYIVHIERGCNVVTVVKLFLFFFIALIGLTGLVFMLGCPIAKQNFSTASIQFFGVVFTIISLFGGIMMMAVCDSHQPLIDDEDDK